jgi:hypothetical protein
MPMHSGKSINETAEASLRLIMDLFDEHQGPYHVETIRRHTALIKCLQR